MISSKCGWRIVAQGAAGRNVSFRSQYIFNEVQGECSEGIIP